jgi:glycosyltransferase involved in cell wall biosynthesis
MKIALLVSGITLHYNESLAITTLTMASRLASLENEVVIISRRRKGEPGLSKNGLITIYRKKALIDSPIYTKLLGFPVAIREMQRGGKFEVIHSFSSSPILVLRGLLSKWIFSRKAKVIHTLKSYPIKKNIQAKKGSRLLSKIGDTGYWLLNFADAVTVPTESYKAFLVSKKVKKDKIKVIKSFIDLSCFFPSNKEEMKKRYGYSKQKIIFNYGSMWEIKGTNYLIESLPQVLKKVQNVKLVLAPRNKEQALNKYMPLITKLNLNDKVEFILDKIDVNDYLNLADAVVLPYPHLEGTEGNPSCLLESLACGTTVVSTNLPEIKELFSECSILVKPRETDSLAEGIISALTKDTSAIRVIGREKAKEFDIINITNKFIYLYRALLKS